MRLFAVKLVRTYHKNPWSHLKKPFQIDTTTWQKKINQYVYLQTLHNNDPRLSNTHEKLATKKNKLYVRISNSTLNPRAVTSQPHFNRSHPALPSSGVPNALAPKIILQKDFPLTVLLENAFPGAPLSSSMIRC